MFSFCRADGWMGVLRGGLVGLAVIAAFGFIGLIAGYIFYYLLFEELVDFWEALKIGCALVALAITLAPDLP
jgi:hypothetical protein